MAEEKCFTVIWKVENFTYCFEKKGEDICSPSFVINSISKTKFFLRLFPRGVKNDSYVGFFIGRETRREPEPVEIKYELSFLDKNGSELEKRDPTNFNVSEFHDHGWKYFAKREKVLTTEKSTFLPQDTLTARCRIWKCGEEMTENVRCFARTRIGVEKRAFVWSVENYSTFEQGNLGSFSLRSLTNDAKIMSVKGFEVAGVNGDKIIRFKVSLKTEAIKYSTLKLSLIELAGKSVECNQENFCFADLTFAEFTFLLTRKVLLDNERLYLPNDTLTLQWEWTFSKGIISNEIEEIEYGCVCPGSSGTRLINDGNFNHSNGFGTNMKSLYDEQFLSDVKLETNTNVFHAHKFILSASSSVFKAMFANEMKEKKSNCVLIDDLRDSTIHQMLVYIYTSRIEDLDWESALHLYKAADKYAIFDLKDLCAAYMKENVSAMNSSEALLVSDCHGDSDLKIAMQDYIIKNAKDVTNSDGWRILMENNPKLAAETLCLHYK